MANNKSRQIELPDNLINSGKMNNSLYLRDINLPFVAGIVAAIGTGFFLILQITH